jgi:dihydrodipicolinate synthase/N-acetylneuraminate lyase
MNAAYATFKYFSGKTPVVLYNKSNRTRRNLDHEYWVKITDTLLAEMRERFGAENVVVK